MAPPKPQSMSGMPAAGIFADMSVDGPVIGTLVAVVDRAKNLPNRKTMGKQNPYCAARLGKEARKTGTDLRGGQTPKWDQELRFTVHESPDYLQLKVSVFNDDKKTELIGETWVDLKSVVIPGGGQSDHWHALSCKGKYAGDVRMELTYYDTRPQDEAVLERRKEAAEGRLQSKQAQQQQQQQQHSKQSQHQQQQQQQQQPPKRRPLPADPTATTRPAPAQGDRKPLGPRRDEPHGLPSATTQAQPVPEPPPRHHQYETPDDLHQQWAPNTHPPGPVPPRQHPQQQQLYNNGAGQHADTLPPQQPHQQQQPQPSSDRYGPPVPMPMPVPHEYSYSPSADNRYEQPQHPTPVDQHPDNTRDPYYYPPEELSYARDVYRPPHHHYEPSEYYAGRGEYDHPDELDPSHSYEPPAPPGSDDDYHYGAAPPKAEPCRGNKQVKIAATPVQYDHPPYQPYMVDEPEDEEGPPPPPPAHRHGVNQHPPRPPEQPPPQQHQRRQHRMSEPVAMTQPLNITPWRSTPNAIGAAADVANQRLAYSASPDPPYQPYREERPYSPRGRAPTAASSHEDAAPNGCSPIAAENYSNGEDYRPESRQYTLHQGPPPPTQAMRTSPGGGGPPSDRLPASSRSNQDLRQVPPRKSVSPQQDRTSPAPGGGNQDALAGVPFSPDSFDALNPNVSRATAVQQPAAAYSSPAEAHEAARQHEVDKLRNLGPIVGNDGRVIDPSDHLPSDTWAPEPDRKSRKPEVVVRFKHANAKTGSATRPPPKEQQQQQQQQPAQPAQPAPQPPSQLPPASRPQSGPPQPPPQQQQTPPVGTTPPPASNETGHGRNRLQKRPHSYIPPSSAQHNPPPRGHPGPSPSHNHTPPSHHAPPPQQQQQHRSSASPSPATTSRYSPGPNNNTPPSARHRNNQHHPHHQPAYQYHGPGPGPGSGPLNPPPIPAKVPIHSGTGPPGGGPGGPGGGNRADALSEEMRRIDIGAPSSSGARDSLGPGPRRGGRRSFNVY